MSENNFVVEKATIAGTEISFEVGRFAGLATAAVVGRMGDCMVLATVVGGKTRDDIDWFPLQVEFQEKLYAGGVIKGSQWVKREGRPSDEATLTGRVIDRSIRPLFTDGYKGEVQVLVTPLSTDQEHDVDVLSLCTVSAALAISGLPWEGPIAGIRVVIDEKGEMIANPTYEQRKTCKLDLTVSSSREAICMVEGGANEASEKEAVEALEFAKQQGLIVIEAIEKLVAKVGKKKIVVEPEAEIPTEVLKELKAQAGPIIADLLKNEKSGKIDKEPLFAIIDPLIEKFKDSELKKKRLAAELEKMFKQSARDQVIDTKIRLDGRKLDQIRPLTIDVGMIPRTHGSGMFKRGETQALTLTTLALPSLFQKIELMDRNLEKRYIHHYNMPPYSVGETGRIGSPSRREIGHGALAERALIPVLPSIEDFPYTIRVVSECVSSNGSTSMASTCGSTLSLMDAGVPIKRPVAGIAMGLMVKDEKEGIINGRYAVLTDIQGLEDHIGDMDFKVTGTDQGITAIQMDIKVKGVTAKLLAEALDQAKIARHEILTAMAKVIDKPRDQISVYAPKIKILNVAKDKIGEIIGPGGRMIRSIIEQTGASIDIDDNGRVIIASQDEIKLQQAIDMVNGLTREIQPGEIFENGKVTRIENFGAFVEILPGRNGLVHVSKMAVGFISDPKQVVSLDQIVKVRVEEIDDMGRINLSMLFGDDLIAKQNGGDRGGDRGGERSPRRDSYSSGGRDNNFSRGGGRRFDNNRNSGRSGYSDNRGAGNRPSFGENRGGNQRPAFRPKQSGTPRTMADWNDR